MTTVTAPPHLEEPTFCDGFGWLRPFAIGWQFGEAGIIAAIADRLGFTRGTCVEFGAGRNLTTELLADKGWVQHLYDVEDLPGAQRREITPDNINDLPACDVMVIDVDGPEWYLWRALKQNPAVVCVEHQDVAICYRDADGNLDRTPCIPTIDETKQKLDGSHYGWPGSEYSIQANDTAIAELGSEKGYTLVATTRCNSIFVRSDYALTLQTPPDVEVTGSVRLNIGAGKVTIPGFLNVDRKTGQEAYPLDYPDASVDEIYASHVLEHFPHKMTLDVLKEWRRVLKPGGRIRIAVPNFRWICERYLANDVGYPLAGYLMGGQTDSDDFHKALFDERGMLALLAEAGFVGITRFRSFVEDCSRLDVSLNMEAYAPAVPEDVKICILMSVPRMLFTDQTDCLSALQKEYNLPIRRIQGVFWGQCLERGLEDAIDKYDWVLTVDYDTIFTVEVFDRLCTMFASHPWVDALAAMQCKRQTGQILAGSATEKTYGDFEMPVVPMDTAHFGLTLFRTKAFKDLPKPWFMPKPAPDGTWNDGRVDEDMAFWQNWRANGRTLGLATRCPIGHLQSMVTWPGADLRRPVHQTIADYWEKGIPEGARL